MSLKALADAVLTRNPSRNSCVTGDKKPRNFLLVEVAQKLRAPAVGYTAEAIPEPWPTAQDMALLEAREATPKPLAPEIESLIRKADVYYESPPGELELRLEAARNDPENATTYYRSLADKLAHVPDPAREKIHCSGCRNIRMEEVFIRDVGPRFVWGCAKGHMEHGHSTPELRRLIAPDSCRKALDFVPVAITGKATLH